MICLQIIYKDNNNQYVGLHVYTIMQVIYMALCIKCIKYVPFIQ